MKIFRKLFIFILLPFAFCLIPFWLACEKDLSPVVKKTTSITPDTTSHNFIWKMDTIGTYSSYLMDVAVIDENNIWAVGEIHTAETDTFDSLGNWVPPYNAVHWNGKLWKFLRIPAINSFGTISRGPINAVFAHSSNDIWIFSQAGSFAHWNGSSWKSEYVSERNGSIRKIWGTSSSNMYFVGNNGNITHYNGSTWQKLETGTTVDIQDIWGAQNPETGEYEILAVASLQNYGRDMELLRIEGTHVSKSDTAGLHVNQSSVWFSPGKVYYITGNGVFRKKNLNDTIWQSQPSHPLLYKDAIRGNDWNDIFIVGSFGLVSHYNGSTWKHYTGSELPSLNGLWNAVAVYDDGMVAVGEFISNRGIILVGRR